MVGSVWHAFFVKKLKERFHQRLQERTGWGKNDLWVVFLETLTEVQAEVAQDQLDGEDMGG